MATTQITDVVIPENFAAYVNEKSVVMNAFAESGVMVTNPTIESKASSGGRTVNLPFWRDVVATSGDANISSDDPNQKAVPQKVQSGNQVAYIGHLNQGWSTMDLAVELAGADPMSAVKEKVSAYWGNQISKRLMSTTKALVNLDQETGGTDDMSYPKKADAVAAFGAAGVIRAASTMGDNRKTLKALAVHPDIFEEMQIQDLIEYLKPSEGSVTTLPTYRGMLLVEDEKCPKSADAEPVYTSILFGYGAFGSAAGMVKNATEIEREAAAGNGGGQETLWSRIAPIVHPLGYKWLDANVAGETPTLAEIEDAANWERVVTDRKSVPLAFYRSTLPGAVA